MKPDKFDRRYWSILSLLFVMVFASLFILYETYSRAFKNKCFNFDSFFEGLSTELAGMVLTVVIIDVMRYLYSKWRQFRIDDCVEYEMSNLKLQFTFLFQHMNEMATGEKDSDITSLLSTQHLDSMAKQVILKKEYGGNTSAHFIERESKIFVQDVNSFLDRYNGTISSKSFKLLLSLALSAEMRKLNSIEFYVLRQNEISEVPPECLPLSFYLKKFDESFVKNSLGFLCL